ncbi:lathosterol oxidase [Thomomys bottae]
MDLVLRAADYHFFTPYVYPASWREDNIFRQTISLLIVTNLGAYVLYFFFATLSYYFVFDHSLMKHPQFLKNQVSREIKYTVWALPWMSIPTVSLFLLEIRGFSKLYDHLREFPLGLLELVSSVLSFLFFTDMLIYFIHRGLHHRLLYKKIHKPHHIWKVTTPFASHAFHPLDGFLQSLPYHIYPFVFPLHKVVYLSLYVLVNIWTISIHDGDFRVPQALKPFINGSAHHTDHHLFFDYNYGQYFTLWDRIGGSFKNPSAFEGSGPLSYVKKMAEGKGDGSAEKNGEHEAVCNGGSSKTE